MTARPLITVYSAETGESTGKSLQLPAVFTTPIRPDLVTIVHTNMNKNHRQPYAVSKLAGHQTAAESWGTGRAVSRIPRVPGGGTHRSGQGAFGNMCRGGHMYAPTTIWRRWHRKVNIGMKRYAVCSALAASAIPALLAARGHRISKLNEVPLVVAAETLNTVDKTKKAVEVLKKLNLFEDVEKVIKSRHVRAGKGKARNRRYTQKLGPLIIFKERSPMIRAFRNIPGVDFLNVERLNLLKLAPGGHLGRLIMWTSDAFASLDKIYGTYKAQSQKSGWKLPRAKMTNTDLLRIMRAPEIAKFLRPKQKNPRTFIKRNPLRNVRALERLNPYAIIERRKAILAQLRSQGKLKTSARKTTEKTTAQKCALKRATNKRLRAQRKKFRESLFF